MPEIRLLILELSGWTPILGNWNGDATGTKIGVYKDGVWYLDNDGSGTWNAGDRANSFGSVGWTPVLGDWNGDGTDRNWSLQGWRLVS